MLVRREFIKRAGILAGSCYAAGTAAFANSASSTIQLFTKQQPSMDYWDNIRAAFTPSPDFINLENGFYSPLPTHIREEYIKNINYVNSITSFYMRNHWDEDKMRIKSIMAEDLGCSPNDFFFTRNTTESLNTIIMGIPLNAGDEIMISDQDYPSALIQWKWRAKRDSLKLTILSIAGLSDDELVERFRNSITPKTKIIHTTHMIHATGQVLPVKRLASLCREKNLEIIVDGAHSYNHIDFTISDLDADYFMCSLHKWTLNPLGSGLLYIKPERLQKLAPLFGEISFVDNDIRKMERLGTLEPPVFLTLPAALDFHNSIGSKRKEQRLHYLKNYWAEKIQHLPGVKINTPLQAGKSGAIGNFSIQGKENKFIVDELFTKYKIFTCTTDDFPVKGVRVTAHLYTKMEELDLLVDAIKTITQK